MIGFLGFMFYICVCCYPYYAWIPPPTMLPPLFFRGRLGFFFSLKFLPFLLSISSS